MTTSLQISISLIILSISLAGLAFACKKVYRLCNTYGVPFITTKEEIIKTLLQNISLKPGEVFYDLGCGDGTIMHAIYQHFPQTILKGYEINKKTYTRAQNHPNNPQTSNFQIFKQNFFKTNLSDAKIIYCYLLPHMMQVVWKKIHRECKPGTLVYSNAFAIKNITPTQEITLPSQEKHISKIYVYKV